MEIDTTEPQWTVCPDCHGQGKLTTRPSRKKRRAFRIELSEKNITQKPPRGSTQACPSCKGCGLTSSEHTVQPDTKKYPHVAIVGGGIGGAALAVACLHRGIPFTLYERDASFNARSQGYGLTLQQASKAIEGLGIFSLNDGVKSTKHVVYTPDGKIIGEWGARKWKVSITEETTKRKNVHIARQTLRSVLLEKLPAELIQWGHSLTNLSHNVNGAVDLTFQVGEERKTVQADLVVGADGIRSRVRELVIGEQDTPLQYLGCIVMLGICPLKSLGETENPLLDSATVFQTVNGHERIYLMPYDADTIMWQLSFPLSEIEAKELGSKGATAMKDEALKRLTSWHAPIPQILEATLESQITGYPVYDRKLFDPALLKEKGPVTVLGDAAHPMSPFKGQGANQALLDALLLARKISLECDTNPNWRETGIRKTVLNSFEEEMAKRSASKVEGSARVARILHTPEALHERDTPRGR